MYSNQGFSLLEMLVALALASSMILLADLSLTQAAKQNAKISHYYSSLFS